MLPHSIIGHLRRHTQTWVVVGTERRAERQTMGVSESTGPYGRSWSEERGMMATSGLLASVAATLPLQDAILSMSVHGEEDPAVKAVMLVWTKTSQSTVPVNALEHIKKV